MKVVLLLFLYFFTTSPRTYVFDYRLDYEWTSKLYYDPTHLSFFVNKESSSYYATIYKFDNSETQLYFQDSFSTIFSGTVSGDTKNPGDVLVSTKQTNEIGNLLNKSKEYSVHRLNDTIIDHRKMAQLTIIAKNQKKAKRNNIGSCIMIIDTTKDMKPVLTDPLEYFLLNNSSLLPRGVLHAKHFYNFDGSWKSSVKLKEIAPANFNFQIKD